MIFSDELLIRSEADNGLPAVEYASQEANFEQDHEASSSKQKLRVSDTEFSILHDPRDAIAE